MHARLRLVALTVVSLMTLVLAGFSVAWACTPQAEIGVDPPVAESGSEVVVTGKGFIAAPVEVRFNAIDGPLLAVAQGPAFTTTVTVPSVPADSYALMGVARNPDGSIAGNPTGAITVGPSAAEPDTSGTTEGGGAPGPRGGNTTVTTPGGNSKPDARGDRNPSVATAPSASTTAPSAGTTTPGLESTGESVLAGSSVPAGNEARGGIGAVGDFGSSQQVGPADSDAAWGRVTATETGPSLKQDNFAALEPNRGPDSLLALGVGLLSAGLVAMFAGFLVAETLRRRSGAGAEVHRLK